MKPKQSEDEKLFRIDGYSYRCISNFAGGGPGVPARLDPSTSLKAGSRGARASNV